MGSEFLPIYNSFQNYLTEQFQYYFIPRKIRMTSVFSTDDHQKENNRVEKYTKDLTILASTCEFGKLVDTLIIIFIIKIIYLWTSML